ncbi:MAG: sugar-binding transcriptional regulator [Alcanivoracaceae bacterium]|nr:sugar-binding transcriptional regulator [Alcanivoracaceae bacterium]
MKNISPQAPTNDQLSLATKAAWLSYIGGYTQSEVAKRLNVSSAKAHRLIAFAHANNVVKIFVEGDIVECVQLEEKIINKFGLTSCIVVPDFDGEQSEFNAIGAAGAGFLHQLFKNTTNTIIGIGKGRTLSSVVEHLPHIQTHNVKFVSVSGGLTRKFSTNPFDVIHRISERTNAEAYFLPVPYMAKDTKEKQMLLSQQSVRQMLDFAKTASVYIVGLGSLEGSAHVHQTGLIEESIWQIMIDKQAVGDFMGVFLDKNGLKIKDPANELALGLSMEDIKGQQVIAIVGGMHKGIATLAALKTQTITDLIIGEESAKKLVKLM